MKSIAAILLILFIGCSPKGEVDDESSTLDSVSLETETTSLQESDTADFAGSQVDEIVTALDSLISDYQNRPTSQYTLSLRASGYEYVTEGVWTFDSLFNLNHCYQKWASEGEEGKNNYFLKAKNVFAFREENDNGSYVRVNLYYEDLGGITYSVKDGSIVDTTITPMKPNVPERTRTDLKRQLQEILQILNANQESISGDPEGSLIIKSDSQIGNLDVKDQTEITADRKLLNHLLK